MMESFAQNRAVEREVKAKHKTARAAVVEKKAWVKKEREEKRMVEDREAREKASVEGLGEE